MSQFDFGLKKTDIDAEHWEELLSQAEEPTCFEFSGLLKKRADENQKDGKQKLAHFYTLLHAVTSLFPNYTSKEVPYRPARVWDTLRSPALEDFGKSDVAFLAEIAPNIRDPEMQARVADVAWVLGRDYRSAQLAIPAYVASALRLEGKSQLPIFVERLLRGALLARMVGNGLSSVTSDVERLIKQRAPSETKWGCGDLMRLLLQVGVGHPATYAGISETLANNAEGRKEWGIARSYWEIKAEWHRTAKDPKNERDALIRAAETHVGEADLALERATPSHGACAGNLMRAVEALREISGTRKRVDELHERILKEQELSMSETTTLQLPPIDISEMVQQTIAAFQSQPLDQQLLGLALLGEPGSLKELRSNAEESLRNNVWSQIIPSVYVTGKGKHMAKKPTAMSGDQNSIELCIKAEMMRSAKWRRGLMAAGRIKPALNVITAAHHIRPHDLSFLVEHNPFVPPGRELIFLRGLYAGIYGDYLTAVHFLIPQIENSIRYILCSLAEEVRTSKLLDDMAQPERDLNELLYRDDVKKVLGEDLVFDLQALLIEPGFGANLRNNLAHGLFDATAFYTDDAVYVWWLVWRICCLPHLVQLPREAIKEDLTSSGTGSPTDEQGGQLRS